jgi:pimeloyl-ACP methyl ester carboxylesterase
MDISTTLAESHGLGTKIASQLKKRLGKAHAQYTSRLQAAWEKHSAAPAASAGNLLDAWSEPWRYAVDVTQRSILFWDTLRQRGNEYVAGTDGEPAPALKFDYEIILDGRKFAQPVNYALVAIVPPAGVKVDPKRRPYVIIDPRAGHGPGIGGFKDESEVGVALAAGHPVYFVMFFQYPEPGQTLLDVCEAEREFVRAVRQRHPGTAKPVVLGNCQGGWAAAMLAAADPDDMGPVILVGAPMSYWGGAWQEEQAPNPMRYSGGLLGGSWLASCAADLGGGIFDGAHLVQNFENLNPAANYWEKYYQLFANADTEPSRFLQFERWWSSYYLMNREEIEWITRNLFIGNTLWSGNVRQRDGKSFDLRDVKSPIVLFASLGDNITPPQQAFNWVADVYRSTEEIKAGGHVIVGLVHEDVGHLGIFVSGRVAQKETRKIVEVMEAIELLPPGIFGMEITERASESGKPVYDVQFREYRLEDLAAKLNPLQRQDERPFEAVEKVSEFNQRAYELCVRPLVKAGTNEWSAKLLRHLHPLRVRNWAISDLYSPWLRWLEPAAQAVKAQRVTVPAHARGRMAEALAAEIVSAAMDLQRAVRDALAEAVFFVSYGNFHLASIAQQSGEPDGALPADLRQHPAVAQAIARMSEGGYAEAFARVLVLLSNAKEPIPLSLLTTAQELIADYADLLPPPMAPEERRRIQGEQEIIVRYEPELAIQTLPQLLGPSDRERLSTLLERLVHDKRMLATKPTRGQDAMLERVRAALAAKPLAKTRRQLARAS